MAYRNGNYCAFYVDTPFKTTNLGANATHDFVFYNTLKMWKAADDEFPFCDSHDKTYNVRDDSDWETLKSRLHTRLQNSKNIILFLSRITKNSRALREEIDYGINTLRLPIIVVYPDYEYKSDIADSSGIKQNIKSMWDFIPQLNEGISRIAVATLHIPMNKNLIVSALSDEDFMIGTQKTGYFYYTP